MNGFLDRTFHLKERGTTVGTELIGGATTFATMAYILVYMTSAMSAVPGIDLTGRHILLIDDVITTGATLLSCAQALYACGNPRISCLTLAAVP